MISAIVVVSAVLFALFIVAAVAGNRAQTRMVAEQEDARKRRETDAPVIDPPDVQAS